MKKIAKVMVLGDGGWGTTLSILLWKKGFDVTLWSPFEEYARFMEKRRTNPNFLKGIFIPSGIRITSLFSGLQDSDLAVVAVPSAFLRKVLQKSRIFISRNTPVVSVVKGIECGTLLRMTEVIREVWGSRQIAALSGPTIASEVVKGIPTTAVVSSSSEGLMNTAQEVFMSNVLRIYTNPDTVGVELGGSLKNIIAIACGISDGLGFGTNAKAAIVSRGLAEMSRLGEAMGARKHTFSGLSGLGDLVTTCFNEASRNYSVGRRIGRGEKPQQILSSMKTVAEGVGTARAVHQLCRKYKVSMPIAEEIYKVLFKNAMPELAVSNLMERKKKAEY